MATRVRERDQRTPAAKRRIQAVTSDWIVLCCDECSALFDVPTRTGVRLPERCEDCRREIHTRRNRASYHQRKIAA